MWPFFYIHQWTTTFWGLWLCLYCGQLAGAFPCERCITRYTHGEKRSSRVTINIIVIVCSFWRKALIWEQTEGNEVLCFFGWWEWLARAKSFLVQDPRFCCDAMQELDNEPRSGCLFFSTWLRDFTRGWCFLYWQNSYTIENKGTGIPASHSVSSRQKLALCPSATLVPLRFSRS